MKRIVALMLSVTICVFFCSCTPLSKLNTISYNDDSTEMYYNGYTYVNYDNYNGKYKPFISYMEFDKTFTGDII